MGVTEAVEGFIHSLCHSHLSWVQEARTGTDSGKGYCFDVQEMWSGWKPRIKPASSQIGGNFRGRIRRSLANSVQ